MDGLRRRPQRKSADTPSSRPSTARPGGHNLRTGAVRPVEGARGNVIAFTLTMPATPGSPQALRHRTQDQILRLRDLCGQPGLASADLKETKSAVDRLAREILDGMLAAAEAALK